MNTLLIVINPAPITGNIFTIYSPLLDLYHGSGTYRVYAAFRDPDGDVLVCDDDSLLEATYEFTVNI